MKPFSLTTLAIFLTACGTAPASPSAATPAAPSSEASAAAPSPVSPGAAAGSVTNVQGAEAKKLVAGGAQLIDVRGKGEFDAEHLPGAKNIPATEISKRSSELAKDKPVVVYCGKGTGKRSGEAGAELATQGFKVYDLGPITAWEK